MPVEHGPAVGRLASTAFSDRRAAWCYSRETCVSLVLQEAIRL